MAVSKSILIAVIVSSIMVIVSIGIFSLSINSLFGTISGHATSIGQANLTVESDVIINFTRRSVNWGSGRVNSGASFATLNTEETGNVTGGNWTLQTSGGLRIENLGNVNVTLNLSGTKTAAQMIGGTSPSYEWQFSNAEPESCLDSNGDSITFSDYETVSTTTTLVCGRFRYTDANDTLRINFKLTIPSDSLTGALGDTITATAFATV